jgi:ABC-type multidrug transport system fused ATPase/permease subunit
MMRFYDPEYGSITLDGEDIRNFNLHSYRTAVSLVMQEPIIFNYSILENILYSKLDASNSEVKEVTSLACCDEFIVKSDVTKKTEDELKSAENLIDEMTKHKVEVINLIGKAKYDEEMETL